MIVKTLKRKHLRMTGVNNEIFSKTVGKINQKVQLNSTLEFQPIISHE